MLCFFSNHVRKNDNYKGLTNKGFARILPGKGIVFKVIGKISGVKLQSQQKYLYNDQQDALHAKFFRHLRFS